MESYKRFGISHFHKAPVAFSQCLADYVGGAKFAVLMSEPMLTRASFFFFLAGRFALLVVFRRLRFTGAAGVFGLIFPLATNVWLGRPDTPNVSAANPFDPPRVIQKTKQGRCMTDGVSMGQTMAANGAFVNSLSARGRNNSSLQR